MMSGALLERGRSEVKEGGVNTTKQVLQFSTLFTALIGGAVAWVQLEDKPFRLKGGGVCGRY